MRCVSGRNGSKMQPTAVARVLSLTSTEYWSNIILVRIREDNIMMWCVVVGGSASLAVY